MCGIDQHLIKNANWQRPVHDTGPALAMSHGEWPAAVQRPVVNHHGMSRSFLKAGQKEIKVVSPLLPFFSRLRLATYIIMADNLCHSGDRDLGTGFARVVLWYGRQWLFLLISKAPLGLCSSARKATKRWDEKRREAENQSDKVRKHGGRGNGPVWYRTPASGHSPTAASASSLRWLQWSTTTDNFARVQKLALVEPEGLISPSTLTCIWCSCRSLMGSCSITHRC